MRKETKFEVFHQVFSLRIEILDALEKSLIPSPEAFLTLKEVHEKFEKIFADVGQGDIEDQYYAYCSAIAIFVLLAEWKHAVRNAEVDAQRFLNSAKLKASEFNVSHSYSVDERLVSFLERVKNINSQSVDDLEELQDQLKHWSLPLFLFSNLQKEDVGAMRARELFNGGSKETERQKTTVAFLKFDIDGVPAKQWNYLSPGISYDLTIEARVSNWPEEAGILSLTPITVDSMGRDWLPIFKFEKPEGNGPFILTGTGKAILKVAHSYGSRPYEFLYAAEFGAMENINKIEILGHRRLTLEGCDVASNPLSGFSNVDTHLLSIRNQLRNFPGMHSDDIANTMIILGGLGNIAAQALRNGLFEANTSEQEFQKKTTEMLRNRAEIGGQLQGHPEAAGGTTDLTFRDITIELKVDNTKRKSKVLFPEDFSKYFAQTAAYAIGLGKRIGVLCVLDSSEKKSPVGDVEGDIKVFAHTSGQTFIIIVVVVVRGGFPKPSHYSK